MEFRIWLENKEAFTKDIVDAILKTVQFNVGGNWTLKQNKAVPDTMRTQLNRQGQIVGTDVKEPGDHFNVSIWVRAHKRNKEDSKLTDPLPSWVKDKSQWQNVDKYDIAKGHELVDINVSVSAGAGKWSFLRIIGDSWQDQLANLRTPLDAANFIKVIIDRYDNDNDNDDGDDGPAPFSPAPSPTNQLAPV